MFQALVGFASSSHWKSTLSVGTLGVAYELFQWRLWTGRVLWGISKLRNSCAFKGLLGAMGLSEQGRFSQLGRNLTSQEKTLTGHETRVASRAESKGWKARMQIGHLGSALFPQQLPSFTVNHMTPTGQKETSTNSSKRACLKRAIVF